MKIIFSMSLIATSILTSVLMSLFVAGCVKVGQLQKEEKTELTTKCQPGGSHELGSSPTLEDVIRAAEGLEKSNQSN